MPELFGFSFGKKKNPEEVVSNIPSFVPPVYEDGATTVSSGGFYGSYVDLDGGQKSDSGFIDHYRSMVLQPEVEIAVQDIINEVLYSTIIELP